VNDLQREESEGLFSRRNRVAFARMKESFSGLYPKVEKLRRINQSE
jgi:hypothetical protein